eukprot:scaffold119_cov219-Ochromonas_danica.AAC.4
MWENWWVAQKVVQWETRWAVRMVLKRAATSVEMMVELLVETLALRLVAKKGELLVDYWVSQRVDSLVVCWDDLKVEMKAALMAGKACWKVPW